MDALQQWTRHADSDLYIVEALLGAPLGPLQPLTEALALAVVRRQQQQPHAAVQAVQAVHVTVPSQQATLSDGGEGSEGGRGMADIAGERSEQAVQVAVQMGTLEAGAGAVEVQGAEAARGERREETPEEVYELKRPVSAEVRAGGWEGWRGWEG